MHQTRGWSSSEGNELDLDFTGSNFLPHVSKSVMTKIKLQAANPTFHQNFIDLNSFYGLPKMGSYQVMQ